MPLDALADTDLTEFFLKTRARSEALAAPLSPEDWMIQSMEEASPVKWNLAHTSWFFETFILIPHKEGYKPFHPDFGYLFNSYYNHVGEQHTRARRGMISRPTAAEVLDYRAHVTGEMEAFLDGAGRSRRDIETLVDTGCAHEEQHQELLLMDIKHALFQNPLAPAAYSAPEEAPIKSASSLDWVKFDGATADIGFAGKGFAFDNEGPRHQVLLKPYALGSRLITNGEWLQFIEAGGYSEPTIWLSDGWATVVRENWRAPLYWREREDGWRKFTLFGEREIDPNAPVGHISYYEAAAFAEWTGDRLPTEFEWEQAAKGLPVAGNFLTNGTPPMAQTPTQADSSGALAQMFGDLWEWTASPYVAYPGYRTPPGAIGEYNGKFMSSQMVLRGGSCASPAGHLRPSYRNFFPPHARWGFSGLRLARDLD